MGEIRTMKGKASKLGILRCCRLPKFALSASATTALTLTLAISLLSIPSTSQAERRRDNSFAGGLNTQVRLRHRVNISSLLYLRVGNPAFGTVDKLTFDLAQSAGTTPGVTSYDGSSPPDPSAGDLEAFGDGTPVTATSGNSTLDVAVVGNVGDINLSYSVSNASGLQHSTIPSAFIPFGQILIDSSDPGLPAPTIQNVPQNTDFRTITGNFFSGLVVNRSAQWTFSYQNDVAPAAGTYEGRITFIASTP